PEEAQQSQSEPPTEPMREWKTVDASAEPVEPLDIRPADERPDWMQATDAISVARTAPSPSPLAWSDGAMQATGESARTSTPAMSAVDVLFASDAVSDDSPPHGRRSSWARPRPRLMARIHRIRIGISSFIGSCFSTTRSLTFLAVMITIATVVVA